MVADGLGFSCGDEQKEVFEGSPVTQKAKASSSDREPTDRTGKEQQSQSSSNSSFSWVGRTDKKEKVQSEHAIKKRKAGEEEEKVEEVEEEAVERKREGLLLSLSHVSFCLRFSLNPLLAFFSLITREIGRCSFSTTG